MEVIAATFSNDAGATAARRELRQTLKVHAALVTLDHLPATAEGHAGKPILVAWVSEEERGLARDVIERYEGRHVPFDWTQAVNEVVELQSMPSDIALEMRSSA